MSPPPLGPEPVTLGRLAEVLAAEADRTRPHVDGWIATVPTSRLLDVVLQLDPDSPLHALHHANYGQAAAIVALARLGLADGLARLIARQNGSRGRGIESN